MGMKNNLKDFMKFKTRTLLSLLLSGLFTSFVFAQKFTISGYVQDAESGEKLLYANIFEPALQLGTISNNYGFFSLTLPTSVNDSLTIVVSYIGYKRWQKKLILDKDTWLIVKMNPTVVAGEAVEVVAEGILQSNSLEWNKIGVGFGGTHYAPAFSRVELETDFAIGHIMPKHGNFTSKMINQSIKKTPNAKHLILDWKGLTKDQKNAIVLESQSHNFEILRSYKL